MDATKKNTSIRFTEQERQALDKGAEELGITVSEYIRLRLTESSQLERIEKKIDEIKKIVSKKK